MPFKKLDANLWLRVFSRCLIIGPPNSRKTTSLLSFHRPISILSYPGEKGSGTIPINESGINAEVWEDEEVVKEDPIKLIKEVENKTIEMLAAKPRTFAGDGIMKLAGLYWRREFNRLTIINDSAKVPATEDEIKLRAYGNPNYGSTKDVLKYISMVNHSNVETIVFTCWEGEERDDPKAKGRDVTTHTFADLPGALARRIVGEFGIVLYSHVTQPDVKGESKATWQIRPSGKVWGVGVKLPPAVAARMPGQGIPQDWAKLFDVVKKEVIGIEALDTNKKETQNG